MKSAKFVGIIGFLVAAVPVTGLPWLWKTFILVVLGVTLLGFSVWKYYSIKRSLIRRIEGEVVTESYVENAPQVMKDNLSNNERPKV